MLLVQTMFHLWGLLYHVHFTTWKVQQVDGVATVFVRMLFATHNPFIIPICVGVYFVIFYFNYVSVLTHVSIYAHPLWLKMQYTLIKTDKFHNFSVQVM